MEIEGGEGASDGGVVLDAGLPAPAALAARALAPGKVALLWDAGPGLGGGLSYRLLSSRNGPPHRLPICAKKLVKEQVK